MGEQPVYVGILGKGTVGGAFRKLLDDRADMVEAGWEVVEPILKMIEASPKALLQEYPAGSWGPSAADALLEREGRSWRNTDAFPPSPGPHGPTGPV